MSREVLKRYKKNKKDIQELENLIEKQKRKKEKLRVVSGKVMKSGDEFPYIQQNITVEMVEPKNGSRIDDRIRGYEEEKAEMQKEMEEAENYIRAMQRGTEKRICEMFFLDGSTQEEIAYTIGYSQGRVSQIIKKICED